MDYEWKASHAIVPLTYSTLLFGGGLIYLSFPERVNRYLSMIWVTIFGILSFKTSGLLIPDAMLEDVYCRTVLMYTAHFWHVAGSRSKLVPGSDYNPHSTILVPTTSPWHRGYKLLYNGRGVGTTWESPQTCPRRSAPTPLPSEKTENIVRPSRKPQSRTKAIIRWAALFVLHYLIFCLWEEFRWTAFLQLENSDIDPEKEVLIRRLLGIYPNTVDLHEISIRLRMVINFVLSDYLKLSMMHSFCAIIFVGLKIDEPSEWPPMFGSLPVRSVRAFWSQFWHTLVYPGGISHAKLVLGLVGLTGSGPGMRFLKNWMVFAISSVLHGLMDIHLMDCGATRSIYWWWMQPFAFVAEEMVAQAWKKAMSRYREWKIVQWFEVVAGCTWVFAWFFWSVPKMVYPLYNCQSYS